MSEIVSWARAGAWSTRPQRSRGAPTAVAVACGISSALGGGVLVAGGVLMATALAVEPAAPGGRVMMRQMAPAGANGPPTPRELVDAREAFHARYGDLGTRPPSAAAAIALATMLTDAAVAETDPPVKWLMLAEARRLAAAAGDAATLDRALVLAAAAWEFDAHAEEYRLLEGIPLRLLDGGRAGALALVAETLATRAETDGRRDVAADALTLAVRGWQRAGDRDAAARASDRLERLDPFGGIGRSRRPFAGR